MGLFLAVLVIIWLLALSAQNAILFGAVWGLVGLYTATRLWARNCAGSLHVDRQFPDRAYTGAEIALETRVRNTGLLPILWAGVRDTIPPQLRVEETPTEALSLGGHAEASLHTHLTCLQRGYYEIGPLTLRIADPLGLAEREFIATEHRPLIVYPRVVPLRHLNLPAPSALAILPSRTRLFEDPARLVGVREYSPADSLRRVHWMATARMGELMVKEFEFGMSRTTMLCLDLCRPDFEPRDRIHAMEMAIVVAASLASHAVTREHLEIGLRVEGLDPLSDGPVTLGIPPRADSRTLMSILELLARVQTMPGGDFGAMLQDTGRGLPWGSTVVVITGSANYALNETLLRLKRQGHAVAVVVVSRASLPHVPPGIAMHRVWDDAQLAAGLHERIA